MGRGRAKSRPRLLELKYSSPQIDVDRLRKELAGSGGEADSVDNGFAEESWADGDEWRR